VGGGPLPRRLFRGSGAIRRPSALVGAIAAFPVTFIAVFLNVALVCAARAMRGGG
jgi:hypothetical protein